MVKRIPIKFTENAIIPLDIFDGDDFSNGENQYQCVTGEVVELKFIGGYKNIDGSQDKLMNSLCKEVHKMPFVKVKGVWLDRLGKLSGFWYRVKMERVG